MAEQAMDVRSSAAFLRQRWRSIAAMGAVGIALGALYAAMVPAQLGSTTLLLFPGASGAPGDGQEAVTATQVFVVRSTPVLDRAGRSVGPPLSGAEVKQRVHVDAKTSNLIEIRAFSRNAQQAQTLSQAVADAYLARLRADVSILGDGSNAASDMPSIVQPAAPATGPSRNRRLLTWALAGGLLAAAGTALVLMIRRRRDPRVRSRDDLADAVGSSLLAVVRGRRQRSVAAWLALFETYEAPAEEAWAFRQMLRALTAPSDSGDPARAGTKRTPGRVDHPGSLTVVALSGDQRAVAVGPQLAVYAASIGITTRFVVATRHDSVASLWAACATDRGLRLRSALVLEAVGAGAPRAQDASPRAMDDALTEPLNGKGAKELRLHSALTEYSMVHPPRGTTEPGHKVAHPLSEPHEMAITHSADLTIVVTVADSREPTLIGVPATEATILAISPGVATRAELARLAVAVDDAGRRIDGVVVSDPDPSDRTTGRRTLDERAMQAPLPVRMTGPSHVSMSAATRKKAR
jgi:capsular polysaccharide biosynthesis protein